MWRYYMVFCQNCGAEHRDNNDFCAFCGESRDQSKKMDIKSEKSPLLAALLNFLVWGLGYYYLDIRKFYGFPAYVLIFLDATLAFLVKGVLLNIFVGLLLAIDVYKKASKKQGWVPIE